MSAPTHPISLAIVRNDVAALEAAIAQSPAGWAEEVVDGYTCWSRVLVDKKRTHMLPVLLAAGVKADQSVSFAGRRRRPFALCVKYGRHQAALQLLDAGASFNVWVHNPNLSVLGAVVQQWNRARHDKTTPASVLEPLDVLLARMLTPTTVMLPAVLNDVMASLFTYPHPNDAQRELLVEAIDTAWAKGVRPDAGPVEREMRHVITPLRLALQDSSPQAHRWLREVLTFSPPTALWAQTLLTEVTHDFEMNCARQVMDIVGRGWSIKDRAWIAHEVNVWEANWPTRNKHASLVVPQLHVRLELLKWGLANGLPVSSLLEGTRPMLSVFFSTRSLASLAKPEFFMEVFEIAFRQGLSLSTLMGRNQDKSWREVLVRSCASPADTGNAAFALTFWENHREEVEKLQAQVRGEILSERWGQPKGSAVTTPRL